MLHKILFEWKSKEIFEKYFKMMARDIELEERGSKKKKFSWWWERSFQFNKMNEFGNNLEVPIASRDSLSREILNIEIDLLICLNLHLIH